MWFWSWHFRYLWECILSVVCVCVCVCMCVFSILEPKVEKIWFEYILIGLKNIAIYIASKFFIYHNTSNKCEKHLINFWFVCFFACLLAWRHVYLRQALKRGAFLRFFQKQQWQNYNSIINVIVFYDTERRSYITHHL